jgi:hypothetical protein
LLIKRAKYCIVVTSGSEQNPVFHSLPVRRTARQ